MIALHRNLMRVLILFLINSFTTLKFTSASSNANLTSRIIIFISASVSLPFHAFFASSLASVLITLQMPYRCPPQFISILSLLIVEYNVVFVLDYLNVVSFHHIFLGVAQISGIISISFHNLQLNRQFFLYYHKLSTHIKSICDFT